MLEIGTQLQGRYVIEEQIGQGGMGAVYLAVDQKFSVTNRVAIKETFYETPELAEAFEREARLLNSLHHPILPHVSDYFTEGGGSFLVMEYIEGEDLSQILKRDGAFPVADVTRWTRDILDGLDYLHSQEPPIIHRDIKPNNLKLTTRGFIVLLDFGLAKENEEATISERSIFGYSRRYSPLEQIEGVGTDAPASLPEPEIFPGRGNHGLMFGGHADERLHPGLRSRQLRQDRAIDHLHEVAHRDFTLREMLNRAVIGGRGPLLDRGNGGQLRADVGDAAQRDRNRNGNQDDDAHCRRCTQ